MRDLLKDPAWRETDLGEPLPDSPFAVSVALPKWQHVVDYEECSPELLAKLKAGYPRFFPPRSVRALAESASQELALSPGYRCSIYPTLESANRCAEYVRDRTDGWEIDVRPCCEARASAVVYPREITSVADDYWRYAGEGVSGRQAAELSGARDSPHPQVIEDSVAEIRERIAANTGQQSADVFLFPSGMAAIATVQRVVTSLAPSRQTVQFDFPYVDVLRVQREMGSGVSFLPEGDSTCIRDLAEFIGSGRQPAAVYCEVPSNPLLRCADLSALQKLTAAAGIPLVVDDTVATHLNVDAFKFADLVTTSLTKAFSGAGDVLAGAVVVNGDSALAPPLREALERASDTTIGGADAIVLAENSRDFAERVAKVNDTTPRIVEFLANHPAIEQTYYPTLETRGAYDSIRKDGGGYSGLLSIRLKQASKVSAAFYDALEVSKGPSLGANFTLACPYTLLAHYNELDWCEEHGVSRWLIRLSIGLENYDDLRRRLERALDVASS